MQTPAAVLPRRLPAGNTARQERSEEQRQFLWHCSRLFCLPAHLASRQQREREGGAAAAGSAQGPGANPKWTGLFTHPRVMKAYIAFTTRLYRLDCRREPGCSHCAHALLARQRPTNKPGPVAP